MRDLTRTLKANLATYPGDPPWAAQVYQSLDQGALVSWLSMGAHAGTHLDSPAHVLANAPGIQDFPLELALGTALVIATTAQVFGPEVLPAGPLPERVLFKTGSWPQSEIFNPDYSAPSPALASELVGRGARLIGIDTPSVDPYQAAGLPVHQILARAGCWNLEGLDLSQVEPGTYQIVVLPLRLELEASPVRALLL